MKIADQWTNFAKESLPDNAPPIQHQEMRRAFYAGAYAALSMMMEIGDDSISEDQGVVMLEEMRQECLQFARKVLEGKA